MKNLIIYTITNIVNGKVYVGKTINKIRRWKEHRYDSKTSDAKLYRAIRKYGLSNFKFDVVFCVTSPDFIEDIEQEFVSLYDSYENGYNNTKGGAGNLLYVFDYEFKRKCGESFRGKTLSSDHKRKISESNKGRHNHDGVSNPNFDSKIYHFKNKNSDEEFVGTRFEFVKRYEIKNHGNISSVISGKLKSYYGWYMA